MNTHAGNILGADSILDISHVLLARNGLLCGSHIYEAARVTRPRHARRGQETLNKGLLL